MKNFKRIFAVGAHQDDLEYSCMGMLLRQYNLGSDICVYVASNGSAGDPTSGSSRVNETRESFSFLSNSEIHIRDSSGFSFDQYEELSVNIREILLKFKPDLVLVHDINDTHQEHRLLHDIVITATRRLPVSIFTYKSVSVT